MKIKQTYEYEKETKGTYRFKAVDDDAPIRDLYIRKSAVKGKPESVKAVFDISEVDSK